jgi:predicted flavoprotein YhiN
LPGVSAQVSIKVKDSKLPATGPLLIALGVSGPAILKLSAWGARILHDKNYQFTIFVNWLNDVATKDAEKMLKELKQEQAKKAVSKKLTFDFPNRLWKVWFSHRVLKVKPNGLIYPKSNCKTWPIN